MRTVPQRSHAGFTLIELMIVVAIIGILAAIAIPSFLQFQLRSKSAEVRVNMKAIATAQHSYFANSGTYVPAAATPPAPPTTTKRAFAGGGAAAFEVLGWSPEGLTHFSYQIDTDPTGASFTTGAVADLNGNGVWSEYGYIHPIAGTLTTVGSGLATTCNPAGTFHPTIGFELDVPGPCTAFDGFSEF
jgi:type IV pilus assembly protein PilA